MIYNLVISSNGKIKEKYQKSFYSTLQSKEKMVLSKKVYLAYLGRLVDNSI